MEESKRKLNRIIIVLAVMILVIGAGYTSYRLFFSNNDKNRVEEVYTCPMHPQIIQDHFGSCPICGMDLVLKKNIKPAGEHDEHDITALDLNEVKLSPSQQVLANVQTERVSVKQFTGEKVFNGYIKMNEKNQSRLSTRLSGKIVKMYVNFEGEYVGKGQPLFDIYSPELVASQKEYLLASDNYNRISRSRDQFATEQAKSLLESSRTRLEMLEMTAVQIEDLANTREIRNSLTHYSEYGGIVTKKYVQPGHWAMDGETIYDIADLSSVWVIANIYENDVQYIRNGQTAEITSNSYPGEEFTAKVNFIDPLFDPQSRTLEVRIDVTNKNNKLKPDMYVKVRINTYFDQTIAVPKNAVIRTGERNIVYVEKEKGVYTPREITVGFEQDGFFAVRSGLKEGETVVSSGGFLIDSESQIQQGFTSGHEGHTQEDGLKINPGQDILQDVEKKKEHQH